MKKIILIIFFFEFMFCDDLQGVKPNLYLQIQKPNPFLPKTGTNLEKKQTKNSDYSKKFKTQKTKNLKIKQNKIKPITTKLSNIEILKYDENSTFINLTDDNITQIQEYIIYDEFKKLDFFMPNDAEVITKIEIEYRKENGEIAKKIIDVNKSIDWQDNFLLQSYKKPVNINVSDVSVTINNNIKNDKNLQKLLFEADIPLESLKFDDNLRFVIKNEKIDILTTDQLRAVNETGENFKAEFFRKDIKLTNVKYGVNKGGFNDIVVTKSDGTYIVEFSFENGKLDIKKQENGYLIFKK